jgi:FKBP-type peptidyl-prolyl cis-trans isomerase FklB
MKTVTEKTSYALGMDVGISFKNLPAEIDVDYLVSGIKDTFTGDKLKISKEEFQSLMEDFQKEIQEKSTKMKEKMGAENIEIGKVFLDENKKKEGVITTDSGLQYIVLDEGDGEIPMADDTVMVHYKGTLIDGTEFDSSIKRGEPTTFPVKGVIPGWTEALQIMKVNSKFRLFVPSALAYGANGAGNTIAPHSVLVFEVELLDIKK